MTYFDEPFLTISVEDGYLKAQWRGFHSGENFRRGLEKLLELVKETKISGYLADISQSKVISLDDQNWLANDWTPRAYENGLQKAAFIVPLDIITAMAMRRVERLLTEKTVETNYFSDESEAIAWLKSSPSGS